jgi:chromosome segregation ATPase
LDNLGTIQDSGSIRQALAEAGSGYQLLQDLAVCEEKYRPAVAFALGSTVLCDNLQARLCGYGF